jgi:hypothetical protein
MPGLGPSKAFQAHLTGRVYLVLYAIEFVSHGSLLGGVRSSDILIVQTVLKAGEGVLRLVSDWIPASDVRTCRRAGQTLITIHDVIHVRILLSALRR